MVQKEIQQLLEPIDQAAKPKGSWSLIAGSLLLLLIGGVGVYWVAQSRSPVQPQAIPQPQASPLPVQQVAALGRLQPAGEVTRLSAYGSFEGARIEELLVKQGDFVRANQVVAVLTTRSSRLASLLQAEKQVQVAQAQLERVKAGSRAGDIDAQRASITRLQAELRNAELEYQRNQVLFEAGALSASERDAKRLTVKTIEAQLEQAQATLGSVAEVRPVDVRVAQAEVENAIATVKAAEANLELTNIRSPINGQVLEVHVRPGELVGTEGIAEIANNHQMYAVAEVYETDINKIRLGQLASITSNAFSGKITGKVAKIGQQVKQQSTFSINPLAETDHKVIEVKVALNPEDSQRVSGFTNLQVQIIFQQ